MTEAQANNLVAAIFAATMCGTKKTADPEEYLQVHEMFIEIMKARKKAKTKPLRITAKMLDSVAGTKRRRF